ncbi:hypothetical protein [Bacteroides bouchesdurhonensis]
MIKELTFFMSLPELPVTILAHGLTHFKTKRNAALQSVTLYKPNIMFVKGNTVYADTFKYLKHKEKRIIALSVKGSADDYEELSMNDPLDVEVSNEMIFWNNRRFANRPEHLTKEGVKTSIIHSRYSNDDQIAIMLNKDASEEDAMYYQKMQEWRDFAAYIAGSVNY